MTLVTRTWEELEACLQRRKHHPHPNPPPGPVPASPSALVTVRVLNHSTVVPDAEIAAAVTDFQTQVSHDFAPAWLFDAAVVAGGTLQPGEWVLYVEDDATVAGALGFHEEMNGVPTGHVFARTIAQFAAKAEASGYPPPTWAAVASHELLEMLGDPRTNMIVSVDHDAAGTSATEYAAEACDAVEQDVYTVGSTTVSNFVLPSWFDASATSGPFDHLGRLHAPLELLPGGSYIGTREVRSPGWSQKTAHGAPGEKAT